VFAQRQDAGSLPLSRSSGHRWHRVRCPSALQRDVPMLLPRIRVALSGKGLEAGDEPWPGLRWSNDIVDIAASRSDVRIGESGLVLRDEPRPLRVLVVRPGDRILEDDRHGAGRTHDRDLRGWPGEIQVATDVFAA